MVNSYGGREARNRRIRRAKRSGRPAGHREPVCRLSMGKFSSVLYFPHLTIAKTKLLKLNK